MAFFIELLGETLNEKDVIIEVFNLYDHRYDFIACNGKKLANMYKETCIGYLKDVKTVEKLEKKYDVKRSAMKYVFIDWEGSYYNICKNFPQFNWDEYDSNSFTSYKDFVNFLRKLPQLEKDALVHECKKTLKYYKFSELRN